MFFLWIDDWVESSYDEYGVVEFVYDLVVKDGEIKDFESQLEDTLFGIGVTECFGRLKKGISMLLNLEASSVQLIWNDKLLQDHETPEIVDMEIAAVSKEHIEIHIIAGNETGHCVSKDGGGT